VSIHVALALPVPALSIDFHGVRRSEDGTGRANATPGFTLHRKLFAELLHEQLGIERLGIPAVDAVLSIGGHRLRGAP